MVNGLFFDRMYLSFKVRNIFTQFIAFKPFEMYKSVFYVVFVTSLYSDGYKVGF